MLYTWENIANEYSEYSTLNHVRLRMEFAALPGHRFNPKQTQENIIVRVHSEHYGTVEVPNVKTKYNPAGLIYRIMLMRLKGHTFADIARRTGRSQGRISEIYRKTCRKMSFWRNRRLHMRRSNANH